ncbi:MAG: hypothetical protein KBI32_03935 [Phycisphaerae bacterium]|nr:hypothetical protein [Phycisphaerae bacterium]HON90610.1 hypothetical protein [Sedimentisphaerales bacterium]
MSSRGSRTPTHLRICATSFLLFLAGCGIGTERKTPEELRAEKLQQEKASLKGDVEQHRVQIEQLRAQIRELSALKDKPNNPYELTSLRIAKISNFFDKDRDGIQETLVVYVQPIDTEGDVVKAAGTVSVQLWNLNNPNGQALLGQWKVEPAELRKLWFNSLAITSYRLTFDRPDAVGVFSEPLTLRVTFTDYLTGETFLAQQVIEPKLN